MRPASGEDGFRLLAETFVAGATQDGGADEKAGIERLCLSLLMLKNL